MYITCILEFLNRYCMIELYVSLCQKSGKLVYVACAIRGENPIEMTRSIARSAGDRTSTIIAIATNLPQSVRRLVFAARTDLKSNAARLDSAPPYLSLSLVDLPPFLLPLWSTFSALSLSLLPEPCFYALAILVAGFFGALGKTLISLDWNGDTMRTSDLHARFLRPCHDTLYNRGFNIFCGRVLDVGDLPGVLRRKTL